ncbi:translocon-associated protein subunit alpha-like [Selaginella moellendorffii]|uniref:translocon-associated protein subunit alpha-like n=1 Tax=Selaginella moellendorffii TaxID=88036 RepID=UPI000D1C8FD7|nr:translocon-associated protein subunit alpha-like [Selaginella moellendorffii]|eukprot:XP_024521890.1 translocon-associated protein subunit alpha-like [Selaginella moellendorffii]
MARSRCGWLLVLALLVFAAIACFPARSRAELEEGSDVDSSPGAGEEVGVVDEGVIDAFDTVGPAAGVDTVYHFPNNPQKLVPAGATAEILVGIGNTGDAAVKVNSIRGTLHLPFDHKYLVQNFTVQEFGNATVPPGVQATFAYPFTVTKFLQPGSFSLVASVLYEVDGDIHKTVFYNGTVEIVESGGFLSGETLFLVTLGLGLMGLLSLWIHGQLQRFSKTRKTKVVETGTRNADAANNEWLQGTAFTAKISKSISQQSKSKKKK